MIWFEHVPHLKGTIIHYSPFLENPLIWLAVKCYLKGYYFYVHLIERDVTVVFFIVFFITLLGYSVYKAGPIDREDKIKEIAKRRHRYRKFYVYKFGPADPIINFNGFKGHRDDWIKLEESLLFALHKYVYDNYYEGSFLKTCWYYNCKLEEWLFRLFGII